MVSRWKFYRSWGSSVQEEESQSLKSAIDGVSQEVGAAEVLEVAAVEVCVAEQGLESQGFPLNAVEGDSSRRSLSDQSKSRSDGHNSHDKRLESEGGVGVAGTKS